MKRPSGPVSAGERLAISEPVAQRLADTMFALSTPSRVLILGCLLDGPCSVSDLTEALGMEQSAVSHQLRVLRDLKLVRAEKVGRRRLYALFDEDVATLFRAGLHHVDRAQDAPGTRFGLRRHPDQTAGRGAS